MNKTIVIYVIVLLTVIVCFTSNSRSLVPVSTCKNTTIPRNLQLLTELF